MDSLDALPSVFEEGVRDPKRNLPLCWYECERARKVKMQSIQSGDKPAMAFIFNEINQMSPFVHPIPGQHTGAGRVIKGLMHLLGMQVEATISFPLAFVLDFQEYCWARAGAALGTRFLSEQGLETTDLKLWWLTVGFYAVICFLGLLRPNEPFKFTLHGLWSHLHTGARAKRAGVDTEYVGLVFGALVDTKHGPAYKGGPPLFPPAGMFAR